VGRSDRGDEAKKVARVDFVMAGLVPAIHVLLKSVTGEALAPS